MSLCASSLRTLSEQKGLSLGRWIGASRGTGSTAASGAAHSHNLSSQVGSFIPGTVNCSMNQRRPLTVDVNVLQGLRF